MICDRCLSHFRYENSYEKHRKDCWNINKWKMILPDENSKVLAFKNYKFKESVPFVVYADLECILVQDGNETNVQTHIPCSIAYYLHCSYDDSFSKFKLNRDPNCIDWFIQELYNVALFVDGKLSKIIPMETLSSSQIDEFKMAKFCHICTKEFNESDLSKHRDHCHFTGKYRGAAHDSCNINYKKPHDIPIIFHNLSGYDAHFIIRALATNIKGRVELLPINKETYISFKKKIDGTKVNLKFIDSYRFMSTSIDELAKYVDNKDKRITQRFYNSREQFELVTQKGVFPYEYIDKWSKLNETDLPLRKDFYSKLNNTKISKKRLYPGARCLGYIQTENFGRIFRPIS